MEENALKEIIPKAWAAAESKMNKKHKHHEGKAQMSAIIEEPLLKVEPSKAKSHHVSPNKARRVHIKSQNTLMEEAQLEQIVGRAWADAEKMKVKTQKEREKIQDHKLKPKPHR